jgi:ubiquinone biosynthesis protein
MDSALLEMLADLPLATQRTWMAIALPGLWEESPAEQEARLRAKKTKVDLDPWRARIIAGLLRECRLDQAIPERHAAFRPVVADGVTFLLERLPQERLHDLLVAQWLLPPDIPPGERLVALATGLPTLWKLGQMIARRSGLDPALSRLLRRLEDGIRQTEAAVGRRRVEAGLAPWRDQYEFEIAETVLAEGSVGLVMPLRWRRRGRAEPWHEAVAKLVKPEAARRLPEEMALLAEVARRLQARQTGYAIGRVDFPALFGEVRAAWRANSIWLASKAICARRPPSMPAAPRGRCPSFCRSRPPR